MKFYRISIASRDLTSINEVDEDGDYICQVAYFFKTEKAARARLAGILAEDTTAGHQSCEWKRG